MIKQGIVNGSILEKKFKILRTSIMLGNIKDRNEIMSSYEEAAKEVDRIRRSEYEELLASKQYMTTSLEEEENRLSDLVNFIEKRIDNRNEFIDDYIKITGNFLDDLPRVSMEDELPSLKARLDNIHEYLNNCHEISELNETLRKKRNELENKYESKANNEIVNSKLEDELIDEFSKLISNDSYYSSLNYTDIDEELNKLNSVINDKLDVMNTFISSYEALKNAGISGAEREEYLSYVVDAKEDYYNEVEKMYMLNIYKLVLDKENDYDKLYQKREKIEALFNERNKVRQELGINSRDKIEYFVNLCNEQFSVVKAQKFNMENIDKLVIEISDIEDKLDKLEEANNREEIVNLINEFSVDSPKAIELDLPDEEKIRDEVIEKIKETTKKVEPNMVIRISEPVKINVKTASDMAKLVMKKVVIVLEPKKFNNTRNKLKEAELELQKEKENKEKELNQPVVDLTNNENFVDLDINNSTTSLDDDIFIDYNNSNNGVEIKLDTKEVEDNKVNDVVELDRLKLELPKDNITIPTEIFVEEPKEEKQPDLFSQTDPFLDDNQFEINNSNNINSIIGDMPRIDNIGTVRPNNVLEKIENAQKETRDINLPTMGITNENKDVPIVSENYIN